MILLEEWPYENAHKYYPFAPTAINNVPTGLLLDFGLISTTNLPNNATTSDSNVTYISDITTDGTELRISLSALINTRVVDFGCIAIVNAATTEVGQTTTFSYAANGYIFEGFVVTGDLSLLATMQPVTTLSETTGRLCSRCIQHMSKWLAGVQVGDQTLSGLVTFKAGAGVDFRVIESAGGSVVEIVCTGAELPPENLDITSDETLFNTLITTYGIPITSINGYAIRPDDPENPQSGGTWSLVADEEEGLSISPSSQTSSITIRNLNAVGCCTQDAISSLVDNIGALNERVGTLNQFLTQINTNLNVISVQTARIG